MMILTLPTTLLFMLILSVSCQQDSSIRTQESKDTIQNEKQQFKTQPFQTNLNLRPAQNLHENQNILSLKESLSNSNQNYFHLQYFEYASQNNQKIFKDKKLNQPIKDFQKNSDEDSKISSQSKRTLNRNLQQTPQVNSIDQNTTTPVLKRAQKKSQKLPMNPKNSPLDPERIKVIDVSTPKNLTKNNSSDNNSSLQTNTTTSNTSAINQTPKTDLIHYGNNNNSDVVTCGRQVRVPLQTTPTNISNNRFKLVQTIHGFNMYVDSVDGSVSKLIERTGTWEIHFISLIGHIVKPGFNILNLGSQTGLEALVMGKIIGPTGKLFIFEPYSISNKIVTANIELNKLQNITTIYKVGAADQKGTGLMNVEHSNTGGSEIQPTKDPKVTKPTGRFQQVQVVEIDRVDALLPADVQIDFALLDVQKLQVKALKGMKEVINRSPNMVLMVEWLYKNNPRKTEEQTIQLLNFFIEKGYKFYLYNGNGYRDCSVGTFRQYTKIQELLNFPGEYVDLFFIPGKFQVPT